VRRRERAMGLATFVRCLVTGILLLLAVAPARAQDEATPTPEPGMDQPAAADSGDLEIEIDLDAQADTFWANWPLTGDSQNVTLVGETQPDCATTALRIARNAITNADINNALGAVGKFYFKIAKLALKGLGLGTVGDAADLALKALESNSASEFAGKVGEFLAGKGASAAVKSDLVKSLGIPQGTLEQTVASEAAKKIWQLIFKKASRGIDQVVNTPCEGTQVRIWIMGTGDGIRVAFAVNGDCGCKPLLRGDKLGRFGVYGSARLVPHRSVVDGKLKITFTQTDAKYEVVAICKCDEEGNISYPESFVAPGDDSAQQIAYGGGPFLAHDTTEWCTYGGGTRTPLTGGPSGGSTPSGDDPSDGPEIGTPISVPDGDGTFWPPTWVTDQPKNAPPATTPPTDPTSTPRPQPKPIEKQPPSSTPPTYVSIKAKSSVLEGGKSTAVAVAGTRVKLDLGPDPALPVDGAARVDEGFADPPLQAVTDASGNARIDVPPGTALPASYTGAAVEVDSSPASSKLVYMAPGADPKQVLDAALRAKMGRTFAVNGTLVVPLFYKAHELGDVEAALARSQGVESVETNYCRDEQETPNDPYFREKGTWKQPYPDQWAIQHVGLTDGADSAWNLLGPSPKPVIVAVVDTGLDWNHADFPRENLWVNTREVAGNGKDDDRNGYVDDVIGYDFMDGDGSPFDRDGHGTFVAGLIAAGWNNGIGIAGINPHARIMVVKALNEFGHTRASYLAEGILYAANNGARIINVSVGGKELTRAEKLAVEHARKKGALVIVAAGNDGVDVSSFGPAGVPGVLAVAATDTKDARASFSNWGPGISLAAPGMDVLSLRARRTDFMRDIPEVKYTPGEAFVGPDARYYHTSGTSFSAPIVSGVASLVLSKHPELTPDQLRDVLQQSAKDIEVPGQDQYTGFGLVDARSALGASPGVKLQTEITGVEVVSEGGKQVVRVNGTATADRLKARWLEIGSGTEPTSWKRVGEGKDGVENGVLGTIPAEEFRGSKTWTLRSVVEHENGQTREIRFQLDLG
jgi:subtilisin family serine protease